MKKKPLFKDYPHNSPYAFSENRLIDSRELEGLERVDADHYSLEPGDCWTCLDDKLGLERGTMESFNSHMNLDPKNLPIGLIVNTPPVSGIWNNSGSTYTEELSSITYSDGMFHSTVSRLGFAHTTGSITILGQDVSYTATSSSQSIYGFIGVKDNDLINSGIGGGGGVLNGTLSGQYENLSGKLSGNLLAADALYSTEFIYNDSKFHVAGKADIGAYTAKGSISGAHKWSDGSIAVTLGGSLYSAHIGIDPTVIIDYESGTAKVNLIGHMGLGIGGRFGFDLDFNYRPIFDMLEELGFDFDD